MKKLISYENSHQVIQALDNGGRFYNIFTKAKDSIISQAEIGKVGGIFNDKQQMILFLEMSVFKLARSDKDDIIAKLDDNLRRTYQKYTAQALKPSEAEAQGIISSNAIITGVPKLIDSKSDFKGLIVLPVSSGNVTTFMMIPLIDQYDVYELRNEDTCDSFLVANTKSAKKLPHKEITLGGVLRELKTEEKEETRARFLEVVYYLGC
jgi:hypothetical protein